MAELRLPLVRRDDLSDPADPSTENERILADQHQPPHTDRPLTHQPSTFQSPRSPSASAPDFIPLDTKQRLKDLILKSRDPRRSLEIFRSRIPSFLDGFGKSINQCSPSITPPPPITSRPAPSAPLCLQDSPIIPVCSSAAPIPNQCQRKSDHQDLLLLEHDPEPSSPRYLPRSSAIPYSELQPVISSPMRSIPPSILIFFNGSNHRIKSPSTIYLIGRTQGIHILPHALLLVPSPSPTSLCLAMADKCKQITPPTNQALTSPPPPLSVTRTPAIPGRRSGKELVQELGTVEEKKAIIVNMSMARKASRGRFIAVGVFLSVLAITSRNLIESMKRVWKIRGHLDMLQLPDRRFLLEFSEEGDFNHVTKGGPWRHKDDAVLVDALKEGQDPETVRFLTVPIWVQFRKIPFYLLCKVLARDLGREVGSFICIDNHARGDICDKFLRARVHLPIDRALRRWVTLMDGVTNEEVVANVHYERLPSFCYICGFIGHSDSDCNAAGSTKRKMYNEDLGVAPVHPDDPRCWFLPEDTVKPRQAPGLLWRVPKSPPGKHTSGRDLAIVAHVTQEVDRLTVNDKPRSFNDDSLANIVIDPRASTDSSPTPSADHCPPPAPQAKDKVVPPTAAGPNNTTSPTSSTTKTATGIISGSNNAATWKRQPREELTKPHSKDMRTTQVLTSGATRQREDEDSPELKRDPKRKILMLVPSLEESLGIEGLCNLRKLERKSVSDLVIGVVSDSLTAAEIVTGEPLVDNRGAQVTIESAQGFVITDPRLPDNPIIFASDSFLQLTEYCREEILGRNCRFLQGPETDRATVRKIRDAIDNQTEVTVQLINYTKSGKKFWNLFHLQPMRDQKGDVQYFIGVQLDGTEHVRDAAEREGVMLIKKTAENIDEAAKELPDANLRPEDLWANHSKVVLPKPHMKDSASWRAIQKVLEGGENIDLKHFRPVKPLGSGDTGSVHLVELLNTGEYFAMKAMDKSVMLNRNKVHRATAERQILDMLDHPFLPTLYASFQTKTHICLITDYYPGGELFLLLDRQPLKVLREDAVRFYAAEVVIALEYLHCQGIIYRDLKPENILLHRDGHISLTDFDLSCLTSCRPQVFLPEEANKKSRRKSRSSPIFFAEPMRASNSFVGTEEYIAPEIITGAGHTSAVDWWALGILLYEMLYGYTPFRGKTRQRTFANILHKDIRFPASISVSLPARQLIYRLLHRDPTNRLGSYEGSNEIKEHPFFRGINWALVRGTAPPKLDAPLFPDDMDKGMGDATAAAADNHTDMF